MQIIKGYDKAANIIYYIAVMIHIAIMCVGYSIWEIPLRGRLMQLAFLLCCVKILMTRYEKAEWILIAVVGALSIASYICTKEKYVVYVAVLIIAARNADMRFILKAILGSVLVSLSFVVILSLTGVGGDISETRDFGRNIVETRYMLGFSHANNLHGTVWYAIAIMIMLFKEKLDWRFYSLATVVNIVLYFMTRSRAGVVVVQLVIIAGVLYRYFNKAVFDKVWVYILGFLAYMATLAITIVSVIIDPWKGYGKFLAKLNEILTYRIWLAYESAYIGDWHALTMGGSHKDTIDNGFVAVPADYGYVIAILFVAFIAYLIFKTYKNKEGILYVTLMSAVFYTFMERSYMINNAYLLSNLIYIVAMVMVAGCINEKCLNSADKAVDNKE